MKTIEFGEGTYAVVENGSETDTKWIKAYVLCPDGVRRMTHWVNRHHRLCSGQGIRSGVKAKIRIGKNAISGMLVLETLDGQGLGMSKSGELVLKFAEISANQMRELYSATGDVTGLIHRSQKGKPKYKLLWIDAIADAGTDWTWNDWRLKALVPTYIADYTSAQLLAYLIREGHLPEFGAKLAVEDDQHNLVIVNAKTRRPLYAIEYGSGEIEEILADNC